MNFYAAGFKICDFYVLSSSTGFHNLLSVITKVCVLMKEDTEMLTLALFQEQGRAAFRVPRLNVQFAGVDIGTHMD